MTQQKKHTTLTLDEVLFALFSTAVIIVGVYSLLLTLLGRFSGGVVILLSLTTFLICFLFLKKVFSRGLIKYKKKANSWILFLIILAIFTSIPPYEWIFGGRDPSTYINTAHNINRMGGVDIRNDDLKLAMKEDNLFFIPPSESESGLYEARQFPGFYITDKEAGKIRPQFLYLYPSMIAFATFLFGTGGGLYLTTLISILGLLAFYYFVKEVVSEGVAELSSLLLGMNFAFIWFSRYPNVEILCLFLLFTGLWVLRKFKNLKKCSSIAYLLAFLVWGLMFTARLDFILVLFPILFVYFADVFKRKRRVVLGLLPGVLLGGWSWYASFPYVLAVFQLKSGTPALAGSLFVLSVALVGSIAYVAARILSADFSKRSKLISNYNLVIAQIFLVIVFVYYIRGFFTVDIAKNGYNILKLGWYLTPGVIIVGTLGVWRLLKQKNLASRDNLALITFAYIFLMYFTITVFNARIYPDHPWWARRFLPVIIPGLIFFATYALDVIKNKKLKIIIAAVFVFAGLYSLFRLIPLRSFVEYEGGLQFIESVDRILPDEALVIMDSHEVLRNRIGVPLYYVYGHRVFPLSPQLSDADISCDTIDKINTFVKEDLKETQFYLFTYDYNRFLRNTCDNNIFSDGTLVTDTYMPIVEWPRFDDKLARKPSTEKNIFHIPIYSIGL